MNLLIINAGSRTIKYKVFTAGDNQEVHPHSIVSGVIERLENNRLEITLYKAGDIHKWQVEESEQNNSAHLILKELDSISIDKIGFRIVHGGEKYIEPTQLNATVISEIEQISSLAPLHNPPALEKIREFMVLLPQVPKYAVFDTAFHATIPAKAYLYGLPYELYTKYKIRRYGFHGTSHRYIYNELQKLESKLERVITCHLGGGASITAIHNGQSIDTSMGFTPLEGLIMATRPGDVDDGVGYYLETTLNMTPTQVLKMFNEQSGVLGISGLSSDMRILLEQEAQGNARASLAIEMYIYRIQKYIGSYIVALGGIDALVFSGGVGAGSDVIRARITAGLKNFGVELDPVLNNGQRDVFQNLKLSYDNHTPVWVIPTNEELQIAREVITLA